MIRNAASTASSNPAPIPDDSASARDVVAALASDEALPVASGVHDLQDLLARRLDEAAPAKWSMRATVGFVTVVCGGFWAGVFLAVWLMRR